MMIRKNSAILKIIIAGVLFSNSLAAAQELTPFIEGRITAVTDGDTVTVKIENGKEFRVRLQGLNAPEREQPYGEDSRQNLTKVLLSRQVRVEFDQTDKLGRVLGRVILDGSDVGLEQLRAGLAWVYMRFLNELNDEDHQLYAQAQAEARAAGRGLWKDKSPVPPWEFRASRGIDEAAQLYGETPSTKAVNQVVGNRRSKTYHRTNCPGYKSVPAKYRVSFASHEAAERAGYRRAKDCPL